MEPVPREEAVAESQTTLAPGPEARWHLWDAPDTPLGKRRGLRLSLFSSW